MAQIFRTNDNTVQQYPVIGPSVPPDTICRFVLYAFASDHVGGVALWTFRIAARRIGGGNIAAFVDLIPANGQKSAGAALWNASIVVRETDLAINVQGGAGQAVDWLVTNDEEFCMVRA